MQSLPATLRNARTAAGLILLGAVATIAGALVFEHVFGLPPCPLCLVQRYPYYAAMPVALATVLMPRPAWARAGLALLALIFMVSAGLGTHHAGVEWGWWTGPTDCSGTGQATQRATDLLKNLNTMRVVRCDEAAARLLGLSLAGWNALVSLALAAAAAWGAAPARGAAPAWGPRRA